MDITIKKSGARIHLPHNERRVVVDNDSDSIVTDFTISGVLFNGEDYSEQPTIPDETISIQDFNVFEEILDSIGTAPNYLLKVDKNYDLIKYINLIRHRRECDEIETLEIIDRGKYNFIESLSKYITIPPIDYGDNKIPRPIRQGFMRKCNGISYSKVLWLVERFKNISFFEDLGEEWDISKLNITRPKVCFGIVEDIELDKITTNQSILVFGGDYKNKIYTEIYLTDLKTNKIYTAHRSLEIWNGERAVTKISGI